MNKLDLRGVWIPAEVLLDKKMSDKEKIILSMIMYLSKDKGYCFATNNYFSDILNITVVSISRIINSLKKKNYIKTNMNYKSNSKEIENRQIMPLKGVMNRYYHTINKNDKDIKKNIKNKKYMSREYSEEFLNSLYANVDENL